MNDRHRRSTAIALAVAAGLAGCAPSPTGADDAELGAVSMSRSLEREGARRSKPVRFVSCSWTAQKVATATIGTDGGTLYVSDHEVRIPAGAVREPTTFVATVPEGPRVALTLEAPGRPELKLSRNAEVRISYARCGRQDLHRRTLAVVRLADGFALTSASEAGSGDASPIDSTDDPRSDALEFAASRRGTFAVAY